MSYGKEQTSHFETVNWHSAAESSFECQNILFGRTIWRVIQSMLTKLSGGEQERLEFNDVILAVFRSAISYGRKSSLDQEWAYNERQISPEGLTFHCSTAAIEFHLSLDSRGLSRQLNFESGHGSGGVLLESFQGHLEAPITYPFSEAMDAEVLSNPTTTPLDLLSLPLHHHLPSSLKNTNAIDTEGWGFWKALMGQLDEGGEIDTLTLSKIAMIPNSDWDLGHKHIAKLIDAIERRPKASVSAEQSELEPRSLRSNNVVHLFQNAPQVRASFELSAETLNERLDLFQQMACWNEPIPLFEPLREMPAALTRAAEILAAGNQTKQSEETLKDEVAKLRALLATVEAELKSANAEIEELKKKPWWKSAKAVAGGSVIGAIVGTAWMISGDEIGPDKRWDMLSDYWEKIFPREELMPEPLHYQLPETWDT